jgi:acetyl esterase/lipase
MYKSPLNNKRLTLITVFLLLSVFSFFGNAYAATAYKGGKLVNCQFLKEYSPVQVRDLQSKLTDYVGEKKQEIAEKCGLPDPDANGIKTYLIEYMTPNYDGKPVKVSGLLVIPTVKKDVYPVLIYQHGTILLRSTAPSNLEKSIEGMCAVSMFAAKGYVVIMPDYIGCGKSNLIHPYMHADTEASAGADMLKASFTACKKLEINIKPEIFIAGYSQGGQAAMALHRLIEKKYPEQFPIAASAPMSGCYSMTMLWDLWMAKPCRLSSILTVKLIVAYNAIYNLKLDYAKIFKAPYDKNCVSINRDLAAGKYKTEKEIFALVPKSLQGLLTTNFVAHINAKKGSLYKALVKNETCTWAPSAPTRIYYTTDDEVVPAEEAVYAVNKMKKLGAKNIEAVDAGGGMTHGEAILPIMKLAGEWFESCMK